MNALAFAYSTPSSHPSVPPLHLSPSHRKPALAAALSKLAGVSDVILLQEVDDYESFYVPLLGELNWKHCSGVRCSSQPPEPELNNKGRQSKAKPSSPSSLRDRVLTCYNPKTVRLLSSSPVDLDDLSRVDDLNPHSLHNQSSSPSSPTKSPTSPPPQPRRNPNRGRYFKNNAALLAAFVHLKSHERFVIANVHLHWNPSHEDVKLGQSAHVARLANSFSRAHVNEAMSNAPLPVVIAGDFNSLPTNQGVHGLFVDGEADMAATRDRCFLRSSGTSAAAFAASPRFHADANLNKFVRWLRVLGMDATLETAGEERLRTGDKASGASGFFAKAAEEGRVLLTTSVRLLERKDCPPSAFFVETKTTASAETSLFRLLASLGIVLRPAAFLGRCVKCGGRIEEVADPGAKAAAIGRKEAPAAADPLYRCDGGACGQYYWWNDLPESSAGRAKATAEHLFQVCAEGGVKHDKEELGMFESPEVGGGRGGGEEEREEEDAASGDEKEIKSSSSIGGGTLTAVEEAARTVKRIKQDRVLNKCGKFRSAYFCEKRKKEANRWTNVTKNFKGCLDYIFYQEGRFELAARLPIPQTSEELGSAVLPNEAWPSDHLCLVARLRIGAEADAGKEAEKAEKAKREGSEGNIDINAEKEKGAASKAAPAETAPAAAAHRSNGKCGCGCVPNILSLFEMAELRKQLRLAKEEKKKLDNIVPGKEE